MLDSFLLILPVFLIIGFGVLLDIAHVLPKQTSSVIGAYVLYVALPVLLLRVLSESSVSDILHGGFWAGFSIAQTLVYVLGYIGHLWLSKKGHGAAASYGLSCSCSNIAFIGMPVVASLLPGNREAMVAAGLAVIIPTIVTVPCQVQLEYLKASGSERTSLLAILRKSVLMNPLMLSTCAGFALGVMSVGLWPPLGKAAGMVADTTAPCMLLALGLDLRDKVRVAFSGCSEFSIPRLATATVVKLIIHPLLAWAALSLCGVSGVWLVVGVIMSGSASALVTYVIAEIYDQAPAEAAMIAVVTNVLNLFTLTVLAGIFRAQGLL